MSNKQLVFLFISLLLVCVVAFLILTDDTPVLSPTCKTNEIILHSDTLYFKIKDWGAPADKFIAELSSDSTCEINENKGNGYYYSYAPLLYEVRTDTVIVYCSVKSLLPKKFNSPVVVVQRELTNPQMMNLLENQVDEGVLQVR